MSQLKSIFVLISLLFLVSCGTKKAVTGTVSENVSTKSIIKTHNNSEASFNTLQARIKGSYKTEDEDQSISISVRMEKDKAIWMSAKLAGIIPLAKVYITPNQVQYYEKIEGTYFDGDFSLLSDWLGMELDFNKVQNLLLGQAIYPLEKNELFLSFTETDYILKSNESSLLKTVFAIQSSNFRLKGQHIERVAKNESVFITYEDYEEIEKQWFPKKIKIIVTQEEKSTQIEVDYRDIDLDEPVSFPFSIPSGYKEITVE
jgi:outer membrane biogenesis lipoprotein LolB